VQENNTSHRPLSIRKRPISLNVVGFNLHPLSEYVFSENVERIVSEGKIDASNYPIKQL